MMHVHVCPCWGERQDGKDQRGGYVHVELVSRIDSDARLFRLYLSFRDGKNVSPNRNPAKGDQWAILSSKECLTDGAADTVVSCPWLSSSDMSVFAEIPPIRFEGKDSRSPLAFRFYEADRVVAGKSI